MSDQAPRSTDPDSSLLEGLFQLAVAGRTGGSEFAALNAEVYQRLQSAYGGPANSPISHGFNRTAA